MATSDVSAEPERQPVSWRAWYALALMFVAYVFNFIDRSILAILSQPIKEDLHLSDTQLGFLGGIAFAIFYTFVGIPIARLADRTVRRNVLATSVAIWSAMTAVCGFVANFPQLLLARIGVAIGEAGGSPPCHSMISDLFPLSRRATALGIYALGIPAGSMLGTLFGGWLNEAYDWRTAFMIVGIPGVLLALLIRATLPEPVRGATDNAPQQTGEAPPVLAVFRFLWQRRSFRYMALAASLHTFVGYGVGYWIPAFFIRSHHLATALLGEWLFFLGFAGLAGTFLGGVIVDRLIVRDMRWYVWLPGIAVLIALPFSVFVYLYPDYRVALTVAAIPGLLGANYLAPLFAMTQAMVGLRMRALAASIILFITNLIGMGLGPQLTGIASDLLNKYTLLGTDSLRWALLAVLSANIFAGALYLYSARFLRDDLALPKDI
jgi:predicted MFS family arabinose efflux permease